MKKKCYRIIKVSENDSIYYIIEIMWKFLWLFEFWKKIYDTRCGLTGFVHIDIVCQSYAEALNKMEKYHKSNYPNIFKEVVEPIICLPYT